ncbi:MAG: hypothetical protein M3083_10845 [Actinomycetota bacterium]|nr:hypothetical protein [Actinomycetota bacterium]MDQ6944833.1 hypothetical protein [Actinomycetota bacterium]
MRFKVALAGFVLAAGALIVAASAAFACTDLAVLNFNRPAAPPGAAITINGSSFSTAIANQPFEFHWNTPDGPLLARAYADQTGNISTTFTVPDAAPGYYLVWVSEPHASGQVKGGVQKARLQVLEPANATALPVKPVVPVGVQPEATSPALIALTVGVGVLSMALLAFGAAALVGQVRRRAVPAMARRRQG